MACKKNCNKDEAQTQDTQPAEPVALNEQEAEQVSGGYYKIASPTGGNGVVVAK